MSPEHLPRAILVDFGGVLVEVHHRASGLSEVAIEVKALIERSSGAPLEMARIEADLRAAWRAYADFKHGEARRPRPREIGYREFWEELVAADWPPAARSAVAAHAVPLCALLDLVTKHRPAKEGAHAMLEKLAQLGIRTGCVSNALSGSPSRAMVREYGFEQLLGVQVYSDEVGVRKPNPEMFRLAAASLGVELSECWYVGDTHDRDVVGGRRAGVARVILMLGSESNTGIEVTARPDDIVSGPLDLLQLLPLGTRA